MDNDSNQGRPAQNAATRSDPPPAGNAASRIRKANVRAALFKKPEPVRIGRFILLERLGAGAMGEVYAAYDEQLDRKVALKLVRSNTGDAERGDERLLREAQTLAQVSHPNVVQVYEAGAHDGGVFIAMEFIRGKTLTAWLAGTKELPRPERQREILRQFIAAGRGLEAAHGAGLAHRDFKPDNVLVGDDGRVRVVDFGLARLVADTTMASGTNPVVAPAPAGTSARKDVPGMGDGPTLAREPPDAPARERAATSDPERLGVEATVTAPPAPRSDTPSRPAAPDAPSRPDAPDTPSRPGEPNTQRKAALRLTATGMVMGTPRYMAPEQMRGQTPDHRSDQFSFCVALFHALHGEWPFRGATAHELMRAAAAGAFVQPKSQAEVPAVVRKAILRGLSAEPADRFAGMGELLGVLEARLQRRQRGIWVTAAAALVTGSAVAYGLGGPPPPEPCAKVDRAMDDLWDAERKQKLGDAFRGSGQVYAGIAWRSTESAIDEYVAAWRSGARDACEATHVHHTQSADLFDRRMLCLDRGRQRLQALLTTMDSDDAAPLDATLVERSFDAVSALPDLAVCSDANVMRQSLEPPEPHLAAPVAEVRQGLAEATTHELLGRYDEALRVAEEQLPLARKLSYLPLHAEALYHLGRAVALRGTGDDADRAVGLHLEAVDIAEGERHDLLTLEIWHELVLLAVNFHSNMERGHTWSRRERAAARRAGDSPLARAAALRALGMLSSKDARHDDAAKHYREAIEILEEGSPHQPQLVGYYHALANSELELGHHDAAQSSFENGLRMAEERYGAVHPRLARLQNDFARLLLEKEDFDGARKLLQAALSTFSQIPGSEQYVIGKIHFTLARTEARAGNFDQALAHAREGQRIYEDVYEDGHRYRAEPHACFGVIDLRQGNFDAARQAFERALAIRREHLGDRHLMTGWTRYYLAESLVGLQQHDAALAQYDAAEAVTAKDASMPADLRALLLSVRGRALLGRGDVERAIQVLERAVSQLDELKGLSWERAAALWALARAVQAGGTDTRTALELAEKARTIYAGRGHADARVRDAITAWIDEHQ
ncbi:MAG TPA: tetratricopeptide repeat protein [Haliangium sp.]|nr:tetratricopeptide repeat protein [Haliangium sp.]